jgi:hypothetical protein
MPQPPDGAGRFHEKITGKIVAPHFSRPIAKNKRGTRDFDHEPRVRNRLLFYPSLSQVKPEVGHTDHQQHR